jgi:hypothetical protein
MKIRTFLLHFLNLICLCNPLLFAFRYYTSPNARNRKHSSLVEIEIVREGEEAWTGGPWNSRPCACWIMNSCGGRHYSMAEVAQQPDGNRSEHVPGERWRSDVGGGVDLQPGRRAMEDGRRRSVYIREDEHDGVGARTGWWSRSCWGDRTGRWHADWLPAVIVSFSGGFRTKS